MHNKKRLSIELRLLGQYEQVTPMQPARMLPSPRYHQHGPGLTAEHSDRGRQQRTG